MGSRVAPGGWISGGGLMRWLLFVLLVAPTSGFAQGSTNAPMPRCGPDLDGQTICRFGVVYECGFIDPDSMERSTGWRWRRDVLRGCDADPAAADLPNGNQGGVPPGFTYAPQVGPYGIQTKPNAR